MSVGLHISLYASERRIVKGGRRRPRQWRSRSPSGEATTGNPSLPSSATPLCSYAVAKPGTMPPHDRAQNDSTHIEREIDGIRLRADPAATTPMTRLTHAQPGHGNSKREDKPRALPSPPKVPMSPPINRRLILQRHRSCCLFLRSTNRHSPASGVIFSAAPAQYWSNFTGPRIHGSTAGKNHADRQSRGSSRLGTAEERQ